MSTRSARRARGQALVFVAVVLPFLVMLVMTAIEVTTRITMELTCNQVFEACRPVLAI